MANKSLVRLPKPQVKSFLWLALLPAAALLLSKHALVNTGDDGEFSSEKAKKAYLYTFGKKDSENGSSGKAVVITNQTPSKLAGKAFKGFFGTNK